MVVELPIEQARTSNVLMVLYVLSKRLKDISDELARVNTDANIATARYDTLEPRWGALLGVEFSSVFTLERYRNILLGLLRARLTAPSREALVETVQAFVPDSVVSVLDFWNNAANFAGPTSDTFFKLNDTSPGNKWNLAQNIIAPNKLLRQLGFTEFGAQVHVHVNDEADVELLRFIPPELEIVKPGHTIVAMVTTQEVIV